MVRPRPIAGSDESRYELAATIRDDSFTETWQCFKTLLTMSRRDSFRFWMKFRYSWY